MKIIAIGDSITEGFPYTRKESWVTFLGQELHCEIINKGINGDLTQNIHDRFGRDVLAFNPTHVIILGGTNDAYAKYPLEIVSPHFTAMIKMSQEHGIIPIIGLPIPSLVADDEFFLQQYRNWLIDCAKMNNLPLINFYAPFLKRLEAGEESKLFVDEVHPSLEGYQFMAEIVKNDVEILK
ncbi:GDSL-type esterase/lipase family protein [Desulfosporosinus nitroreducens]|uniref:GDSL-type esterase/lipase family protein n=1 Tax=Desulfosporosinus nitroreducens TaxID=2018668 RepID=UPI00207CD0AD|nr:GDSL-type esterase/lipase family protein [Desulfosporosinus nitroreducens]MCO1602466.1 GDSL-type esterase/lipase family protein [Desulfosporosinus nitroreducens]